MKLIGEECNGNKNAKQWCGHSLGSNFLLLPFVQDKVEDQGDNDPLVVVDEHREGFREHSEGEAVNMKSNNPGHFVAATQTDSQKHAKSGDKLDRLEDEVQEVEPFAMVEFGESVSFTS